MQIDLNSIWNNTQTVKINQQKIKTFPTEDLLLYLCIHGSLHLYERIEWVKDIDLLIREKKIDWDKIIIETDNSSFRTMVFIGLNLSSILFETKLPTIIFEKIHNDRKLLSLAKYILKRWERGDTVNFSTKMQDTYNMLKLFPGFKKKIIYLNKKLFKPTFEDYSIIDLPKGFYWGYYPIRVYRLIKNYFLK